MRVARVFSGDALFIRMRPTLAPVLNYYCSTRTSGQELRGERALSMGTWILSQSSHSGGVGNTRQYNTNRALPHSTDISHYLIG